MAETKLKAQSSDVFKTGWVTADETWTYASASAFTISGDQTGKYQVGDKLKLTNSTVKYFYITGVSYSAPNTIVTVTGGSDYALVNETITSNYYSKIENPQGFPHWFNYTPSNTNITVGDGTLAGRFCVMGRTCMVSWIFLFGTTSSIGGNIAIGLPITCIDSANLYIFHGTNIAYQSGSTTMGLVVAIKNTATANPATTAWSVYNATVPFTWANGNALRCVLSYQI